MARRENGERKHLREEAVSRLSAPVHVTQSRFEEHAPIQGYYENRAESDFLGCDRLMKWDHLYGTVQMGYDPKRGQSFLFANIKASLFDTAASRYQKKMDHAERVGHIKSEGSNRAFTARRRENSAVLLYKAENKPWSESSIRPYLRRVNMEALRKSLPFLGADRLRAEGEALRREDRELAGEEYGAGPTRVTPIAAIRARRVALASEMGTQSALIWRAQAQTRLFFRKVNLVFDLQKRELFAHYRSKTQKRLEAESLTVEPVEEDENQ